jgi:hypothetical protein
MSVLCLGDAGTKKYLSVTTFKDKVYVHIRVFLPSYENPDILRPMQSGVALSVEQWNKLVVVSGAIDNQIRLIQTLQHGAGGGDVPICHERSPISLGQDTDYYVVASLWKGDVKVHIRAYKAYSTKLYPTAKGITLTVDEWTTLTKHSDTYLSGHLQRKEQDHTEPIDIIPENMPILVIDEQPRKVVVKQEPPSTPTNKRSIITRDGNPLDCAPKRQKLHTQTNSDVETFLAEWAAELIDDVSNTENTQSIEKKMKNCEACQLGWLDGNQAAHYEGCMKDIVSNMY